MKKITLRVLLALIIGFCSISISKADIWIVTSRESQLPELTTAQYKKIWLGDLEAVNGNRIIVVDHYSSSDIRKNFYQLITSMSQDQVRMHWAKKLFSRGKFPPDTMPDDQSMIEWLQGGKNRMAYIRPRANQSQINILYIVRENGSHNE